MSHPASLEAIVHGRVQGVFFRAFVVQKAEGLGLKGYVRNLPGGDAVQVVAEGNLEKLEKLLDHLKVGPPAAKVEKVETRWPEHTGKYHDFRVRY
ncbi:MAG: acylphosphatase [Chloroflexi bacterium]|nr:acylphosphatase [Chloroflexota bacterium]